MKYFVLYVIPFFLFINLYAQETATVKDFASVDHKLSAPVLLLTFRFVIN